MKIAKKASDKRVWGVSKIINFEIQKSVFGHIFVEIRKGGPNIIFKENIF